MFSVIEVVAVCVMFNWFWWVNRACPISANLLAMNKVNKCKAEQNYKKVAHC